MLINFNITKRQFKVIFLLGVFSVFVYLSLQVILHYQLQYEYSLLTDENRIDRVHKKNYFEDLSLSALAYYVWDIEKEEIISRHNEKEQLPLASLTKLMTSLIASEIALNESVITINENYLEEEGDNGLINGEKWSLSNLIDFVLISSSNDGARALASIGLIFDQNDSRKTFVKKMNIKAKELGMKHSFFLNESGLDIDELQSGAYGSAKDVAILIEYILQTNPRLLEASAYKQAEISSDLLLHQVNNTNELVEKIPGVIASKTGFTDLAGGNLAMAFDIGIGHNIIAVVLGSTKEGRFKDMEKLIWASILENSK
ncbi:MAG: D-alanyl-D-alanine carboxypeptidase [Candidatus Pacebacteria bacterium]|nr:D-alanyl-D-alanine carboxypeptidase [Candidatus Paceibacterota bacterium]